MLYSTGIRVTELLNLQLSNIYLKDEYIQVIGKGKKEKNCAIWFNCKKNAINLS